MTGQCDRGCDAGWTGIICNKGTEKIIKIKHKKNEYEISTDWFL